MDHWPLALGHVKSLPILHKTGQACHHWLAGATGTAAVAAALDTLLHDLLYLLQYTAM
jgi:hypothetical protein